MKNNVKDKLDWGKTHETVWGHQSWCVSWDELCGEFAGCRGEAGRAEERESMCREAGGTERRLRLPFSPCTISFLLYIYLFPFIPTPTPIFCPLEATILVCMFFSPKWALFCMLLFLICVNDIVFLSLVSFIFTKNRIFKVQPCCCESMARIYTNYLYDFQLCHQLPSITDNAHMSSVTSFLDLEEWSFGISN